MTLDALLADPLRVKDVAPEDVPDLLGELERVRAALWLRLVSAQTVRLPERPPRERSRMLTAAEVGEILSVSPKWAYTHADVLGARKLSPRCIRFPERAVRAYLKARSP